MSLTESCNISAFHFPSRSAALHCIRKPYMCISYRPTPERQHTTDIQKRYILSDNCHDDDDEDQNSRLRCASLLVADKIAVAPDHKDHHPLVSFICGVKDT
ncbi:hypothetical protein NXS19_004987 [Fusarium pseudograminearum]|nr:hypothetical protein NXS19_004987 [Fusarium pseudograminearum]